MKYLILSLLLIGCASTNNNIKYKFDCVIFDSNKNLIELKGMYSSVDLALRDSETVRLDLIKVGLIPINTQSKCYRAGEGK